MHFKTANDTKLRSAVNTLKGRAAVQKVLVWREKWANRSSLMLSRNEKYQVLQAGRKSPWLKGRLGTGCPG